MLELQNDRLTFNFPEIHEDAKCSIEFQRTLRIPDDDGMYPLPPGLGAFPLRHIDDYKDRVPAKWNERGGVMLPMYQSEALWINFHPHRGQSRPSAYPFAIRIATGKQNAVTGKGWVQNLRPKEYVIIPEQPWLDGYAIGDGVIRQFVAAPLGMGFTAEEQLTGKAEHGGIQIEVYPMKAEVYEKRFPKIKHDRRGVLRSAGVNYVCESSSFGIMPCAAAAPAADMGLAPGGKMKQQIFEDPYDFEDWDKKTKSRVFVHLANSLAWKAITKQEPPTAPQTAADYTAHGLPWFDHYRDDLKTLVGTGKLKSLKSVMQMGFQKGFSILPENEKPTLKSDQIHVLTEKASPNAVREGSW